MTERREKQLAYSEQMALMLDEQHRRAKAAKIGAVLEHFLGVSSLDGLRLVDIGCSAGFIASEMARRGACVIGTDIDAAVLASARERFPEATFIAADGERLPIASESANVVVLNHIYEHVLDPVRVVTEIERILAPKGVVYLGLANRLIVMEPHYRLPFLSWLPRPLAHAYVRTAKRADFYHEKLLTRSSLKRLFARLDIWDYSYTVIAQPALFAATDMVSEKAARAIARLPGVVRRALEPFLPTYIWIGTRRGSVPAGGGLIPPRRISR